MRAIIVCNNKDCVRKGAATVQARIKEAIAQTQASIDYATYKCFGACDYGPNALLYPQLELYSYLTPADAAGLVECLQGGGLPPAHLIAELDDESQQDVAEAKELVRADYE